MCSAEMPIHLIFSFRKARWATDSYKSDGIARTIAGETPYFPNNSGYTPSKFYAEGLVCV